MSGSGSWQNLLPDEQAQRLYADLYLHALPASQASEKLRRYFEPWKRARVIRTDGQQILPTGPIMTDNDLEILRDWFKDMSEAMSHAVLDELSAYGNIALDLAGRKSAEQNYIDNILTIMICALTLDSQVFYLLREELMGTYPDRDFAGTFFFWGYGFSGGPSRIFGFTTYGRWQGPRIHVLRSHGLDRTIIKAVLRSAGTFELIQQLTLEKPEILFYGEKSPSSLTPGITDELRQARIIEADDPPRLSIPVFTKQKMNSVVGVFNGVAEKIKQRFLSGINDLDDLINKCSFRKCTKADIYCMLFHLSYSYAADKLVENRTIPDFPESAGGEWGVWIH